MVTVNSLRAAVLGANDGIISNAALLLGVIGSGASDAAILTAGIASTVAGAVSMALGEYVSVSAQRDTERAAVEREIEELEQTPDEEAKELAGILSGYGISDKTAHKAAQEIGEGDPLTAHLQIEYGLDGEKLTNPWGQPRLRALPSWPVRRCRWHQCSSPPTLPSSSSRRRCSRW